MSKPLLPPGNHALGHLLLRNARIISTGPNPVSVDDDGKVYVDLSGYLMFGPDTDQNKSQASAEIELAALREELATTDRVLRSSVPEEHKGCASPVGAAQNYIGDLEQRLADAERRNAELLELLRDVKLYGTASYCYGGPSVSDRINAALTKTEEAKS